MYELTIKNRSAVFTSKDYREVLFYVAHFWGLDRLIKAEKDGKDITADIRRAVR